MKSNVLSFLAGLLIAATLAPFAMRIDIFQAIGLSVVILGATLFVFGVMTILGLVAFCAWHMGIETLEAAWEALKKHGLVKEA